MPILISFNQSRPTQCWADEKKVARKARGKTIMSKTININGVAVAVPENAVAYKYADPIEDARWIYDASEAESIRREDPSLIVMVAA